MNFPKRKMKTNHQAMQGEGCMRRGLRIISAVECSPVLPLGGKDVYYSIKGRISNRQKRL